MTLASRSSHLILSSQEKAAPWRVAPWRVAPWRVAALPSGGTSAATSPSMLLAQVPSDAEERSSAASAASAVRLPLVSVPVRLQGNPLDRTAREVKIKAPSELAPRER